MKRIFSMLILMFTLRGEGKIVIVPTPPAYIFPAEVWHTNGWIIVTPFGSGVDHYELEFVDCLSDRWGYAGFSLWPTNMVLQFPMVSISTHGEAFTPQRFYRVNAVDIYGCWTFP